MATVVLDITRPRRRCRPSHAAIPDASISDEDRAPAADTDNPDAIEPTNVPTEPPSIEIDGVKLSADDIRHWIVSPPEASAKAKSTKKPPMPAKYGKLPAADLDAMVAYMQSLK